MPCKYPSDLTFLSFRPDLTSRSAQKRGSSIDPAQHIAAGEEADRAVFKKYPGRYEHYRPVGYTEFAALLQRCEGYPLPGITSPRTHAFMGSFFRNGGTSIYRELYPCTKRTWNRLVLDAYSGSDVSEYIRRDPEYSRSGCVIYSDEITCTAQPQGAR